MTGVARPPAGAGQPASAFNTQYGDVQGRAGGVYQLYKNTVLRGGFGRFYLPEAAFGAAQGFAQDTVYVTNNIAGGTTPDLYTPRGNNPAALPLVDPFPTVLKPSGSSLGLSTFEGQSIVFNNVNRKIPRANQWSFGVEQQLRYNVKSRSTVALPGSIGASRAQSSGGLAGASAQRN